MKNLLKFSILFVFLSFFISPTTFAETPTKSVVLATVNIGHAEILSHKGNVFNIAFSLSNQEGLQTGVKYRVQLIKKTDKGKLIADEKIYDESLTLNANTTTKKEITYTAPTYLSGSYNLRLTSNNTSGFPFGTANLGKVDLVSTTAGIQILPETCTLQVIGGKNGKTYSLNSGIGINNGENLSLTCEAMNSSKVGVTVIPSYESHSGSSFGDIISQSGGSVDPITFKAGEKKSFSVTLPKATSPELYNVKFTLNDKNNKSNIVDVNYIVLGAGATIYNLSSDKDYYNKGDTALFSTVYKSNSSSPITSSIQVSDGKGKSCAKPTAKTLSSPIPPKVDTSVAIKSLCVDPKIMVTLTDDKGTVLAEKEFNIKTTSAIASPSNSKILYVILILVLLIIIILIYIKRKNTPSAIPTAGEPVQPTGGSIPMGMILFFLLVALFGFIPSGKVSADTISYNNGWLDLSIGNFTGTAGDPYTTGMTITAYATYTPTMFSSGTMIVGATNGVTTTTNPLAMKDFFKIPDFLKANVAYAVGAGILPAGYTKLFSGSALSTLSGSATFNVQATSGTYSMKFADDGNLSSDPKATISYIVLDPPTPYLPPTVQLSINGSTAPLTITKSAAMTTGVTVNWTPSGTVTGCSCTTNPAYTYTDINGNNPQTSTNCGSGIGFNLGGKNPAGINNFKFSSTTTFSVTCNDNGAPGARSSATPTLYYPTCFTADTLVTLADGTKKNIQDVVVGDVLKGDKTNNKVLGLHRPELSGKLYSFNGGRYFVTEEHPFKTLDGWKSINPKKTANENIGITVTDLKVGDTLVTDHGNVLLKTIDSKVGKIGTGLYNFFLNGDHTYYADGYLVHNKAICNNSLGVYCNISDHSIPACISGTGLRTSGDGNCGVVYPAGGCATGYTPANDGGTTVCNPN